MHHALAPLTSSPALPKRQRFRPVPLLLAACLIAAFAQSNLNRGAAVEGALWYLAAGLAFLRALAHSAPAPLPLLVPANLPPLTPVRIGAVAAGLAIAAAASWSLGAAETLTPALSIAIAGVIIALVGADAPHQRAEVEQADEPGYLPERRWWAALGMITAIGLGLRLAWLDTLPVGIWYDEAIIGLEAARIAFEPDFRPLYSNGTSSPAAFIYFVAGAVRLLGQDAFTLRLVSVLVGTATVPVFALLLRELSTPPLALIGAFLMAVCRWDITFSRMAMQGPTTPLIACLALWLVVSGIRRGSAARLVAAGTATGVGLLFYTAFLTFPGVIAAAFGLAALAGRKLRLRQLSAGVVLFSASAVATATLFGSFALHHQDDLLARPSAASVFSTTEPGRLSAALRESAGKHLGMFHFRGDANGRHNLPLAPMLDPLTGMAAAMGLAVALRRPLVPLHGLALVWTLTGLLPGVLSLPFEAPQGLRSIGAIPAVLALAALALDHIWRLAGNALGRRRAVLWSGGAAALGACAVLNASTYFIDQAGNYDAWAAHSTAETLIARDLREVSPARADVLVSPLYWRHPTIAFLHPTGYPLEPFDLAAGLPLRTGKEAVVLYLEPRDHAAVSHLTRLYPEAQCDRVTVSPERPETLMERCTVRSAAIQSSRGLDVRYLESPGGSEARGQAGELAVVWGNGIPVRAPFQAFWSATLHAPASGAYGLRAAGGSVQVRIDDTLVLSGSDGTTAQVELAKGLHSLSATATAVADSGRIAIEWQPPGSTWQQVPAEVLLRPTVMPSGLTGEYFPNAAWSGPPGLRRVDWGVGYYWHLTPLPRPYTVEWTGSLRAPTTGRYRIGLHARSAAVLSIDGREALTAGTASGDQSTVFELTAGLHPVRLRYLDQEGYSYVHLTWTPPGGVPETIPAWALRPW